jgi:hypothetical protein
LLRVVVEEVTGQEVEEAQEVSYPAHLHLVFNRMRLQLATEDSLEITRRIQQHHSELEAEAETLVLE